MNKTKELKKILRGSLVVNEKGYIQRRPKHAYTGFNGLLEGCFWVMCFGVMMRTRTYHSDMKRAKAEKYVDEYMHKMGRPLHLEDNPDAIASLTGYPVAKPGIMAVEFVEKTKGTGTDITVTFCTGRSPFCLLRCMRQFRKLEKKFGDLFERVKET